MLSLLGVCASAWVAQQGWRITFSVACSLVSGAAVAALAAIDGGVDSPLLVWSLLPLVYVAAVLTPAAVLTIAAATVLEAMASHRPYRAALGIEDAIREIRSKRGTAYDPQVVDAAIALYESGRLTRSEPGRPSEPGA